MKVYCITGMHRSGTSMVSRVANLLGLELGPVRELVPPQPANPRGHWENELLTLFNDRLLAELDGTWDAPPAFASGWHAAPALNALKLRARALLEGRFAGASLAGWKDPRNSLLLPFWQDVIPIAGTVLCLRHPSAVAASLLARNGFDAERSAELWLFYVLAGRRHARDGLVLDYDRFFADREAVVRELARFLGLGEPSAEALQGIIAHVDPKLRHHESKERAEGPCSDLAIEVYRVLCSGGEPPEQLVEHARQAAESALASRGDRARALASALRFRIDQELALLAHRDELIDERGVAVQQRDELAAHRDDLIKQRGVAIQQRDELAAHRDDLIEQRGVALQQRDELAAHRDNLVKQRGVALQQRDELAAHRDDLIKQRDVALQQCDELAAHRDDLIKQRDVALQQRDELAAHRDDLIKQRDVALQQRDELAVHRDDLIAQRDVAIEQRDVAMAQRDELIESQKPTAEAGENAEEGVREP